MKYRICKTSDAYKSKSQVTAPCEYPTLEHVPSTELYEDDKWYVTIKSLNELNEFLDSLGLVVYHPAGGDEEYPTLEIYDDYRE